MFTGIIEEVGTVLETTETGEGRSLQISASFASALVPGQSVSVNGACLTVTKVFSDRFEVTAVAQTLRQTNLDALRTKALVNLERALAAGGRFEGHLVQGHIDSTCSIIAIQHETQDRLYTLNTPPDLLPYLIPRGSVALDGISLTIAEHSTDHFTVAIIPYTYANTTAHRWQIGTRVNLECDMLGKYVLQHLAQAGYEPRK